MEMHYHIGPRIRSMRKRARVTQRELAARLGVALYQTVQKWESGERPLTLAQLAKVARALGHAVKGDEDVKTLFGIGKPVSTLVERLQWDLSELQAQIGAKKQRSCRRG